MSAVSENFFRRGVLFSPLHILRADALVVRPVDYKRGRDTGKPLLSKLLAHLAYRSVGVQPGAVIVAGDGVFNGGFAIFVSLRAAARIERAYLLGGESPR